MTPLKRRRMVRLLNLAVHATLFGTTLSGLQRVSNKSKLSYFPLLGLISNQLIVYTGLDTRKIEPPFLKSAVDWYLELNDKIFDMSLSLINGNLSRYFK